MSGGLDGTQLYLGTRLRQLAQAAETGREGEKRRRERGTEG